MAIFGKEGSTTRTETRSAGSAEASLSIIAGGMRIVGDVESSGVVKVDGQVDGSVTGARQILLGRGGSIHGNVLAEEVVIGGEVHGSVVATERLELQASAVVDGDIQTKSIVVLEGARINGVVRMSDAVGIIRAPTGPEPLSIATG